MTHFPIGDRGDQAPFLLLLECGMLDTRRRRKCDAAYASVCSHAAVIRRMFSYGVYGARDHVFHRPLPVIHLNETNVELRMGGEAFFEG
jgi:hypothetical protein